MKKLLFLIFVLLFSVPVLAQEASAACVETYDPDVDYFPDKA